MVSAAIIELIFYRILVTKYLKAASLTILFYDYLLTLDSEINLIWQSPWGLGKVLYFLARYSAMVDTPWAMYESTANGISPERCHHIYIPSIWFAVFGLACAEGILFLRTSALYGNMKKVALLVVFLWAASLITCVVIVSLWLRTVTFGPAPYSWWQGCYQTGGSKLIYASYITLLLQETIIVILTVYRAIRTGVHSSDRLVKTLYRDGLFYFFYLLIIAIGNIIVLGLGPLALIELIAPLLRVMHATLSSRVLLHARGAARHKEVTITDLRFAVTTAMYGAPSAVHIDFEEEKGVQQSGSNDSDDNTEAATSTSR